MLLLLLVLLLADSALLAWYGYQFWRGGGQVDDERIITEDEYHVWAEGNLLQIADELTERFSHVLPAGARFSWTTTANDMDEDGRRPTT